jgi:hypothetical protein
MVVDQPARAPGPARLLVRGERQHHVARRAPPLAQPLPDHRDHHRVHVLHVHRAAAPDAVVARLAGERVHLPVARVRGHHIKMTMDEQRGPGPVLALDPGHDAGPFRVRLEHDRLQADLREQFRDALGRPAFPRPRMVTRVSSVDPDQVARDGRDLILRVRAGLAAGRCVFRHLAIVALCRGPRAPGAVPNLAGTRAPWLV